MAHSGAVKVMRCSLCKQRGHDTMDVDFTSKIDLTPPSTPPRREEVRVLDTHRGEGDRVSDVGRLQA